MILKEKQLTQPLQTQPIGLVLAGAVSFLATDAVIGGVTSPLAAAVAGALPPVYALAVLAGGLLSFFLSGMQIQAGTALCALVITVLLRCLIGERVQPRLMALTVGGSVAGAAILFLLLGMHTLPEVITYLFLGGFAAVCTYFFSDVRVLWMRGETLTLEDGKGVAFAMVYLLLVAVTASVSVSFFRPGLMLAAFAILTASERYRSRGGLLCGALTTAGILLCDAALGQCAVLLAVAGLAAGYFADFGKGAMLGIFLAANAVAQLLTGFDESGYIFLGNLAIGCLVYFALPARNFLDAVLPEQAYESDSTSLAAVQMGFLVESLAGVRQNAEQVARMLERSQQAQSAVTTVSEEVCGHCSRRTDCWGERYSDVNDAFTRLAVLPRVSVDELFAQLPDCQRREVLSAAFTRQAKQRAVGRVRAAQLLETRELLFSQMHLTEEILRTATERLSLRFCAEQTRTIAQALEEDGYPFHTVMAYYTPSHRLSIELYARADAASDAETVCGYLSDVTQRSLSYTEVTTAGREQRICLWEDAPYSLICCGVQASAQQDEPCGDSFEQFTDCQGNTYLVLSDGMGTGRQAAVDSRIVISNFKRLILSGVSWQSALSMVNSIMLTKSGEERFATMDCVRLDGETGEATMVKLGASPTLLWQDGQLRSYQSPSCPVGITTRTEPFVRSLSLTEGDVIILLSDGVDSALYPALRQVLAAGCTLDEAAEQLCDMARKVGTAAPDDITVLLSYVEKNNK